MKKLLLILALIAGCVWTYTTFASSLSFGCSGANCFLAGVKDAGKSLGTTGVVTGVGLAQAVQNFVKYLLGFVTLVAVIYIMYAGARLLLTPGDEESATKTKKIILGVIAGIVIIWFAWWIVSTVLYVLNNGSKKRTFIPQSVAETQIRNVDFTTYSNKIEALKTKLDAGYSPEVINELTMLVDGAYDHMPDREDLYKNKQLYDAVKNAIAAYNLHREIIDRGILQTTLRDFLDVMEGNTDNAGVFTIISQPEANPPEGSAPHSVTFEAKQTIDESGTLIPNENYIWWLRTGGNNNKILGKGKIINYTFDTEGTYSVFLTINSASKNKKGFTDTISFEDNVTVEVKQAQVHFVVKINDQIVTNGAKVSTKDALKPIRIDASETRFASGYTIKSTEWDFGNENTDTNEGNPQFESQQYAPGEYTIRLNLIRNDGEEFPYTTTLKIGDPLASISTSTLTPNKGEKIIFQARKTSNEADVEYTWEVKKQGSDKVLHTFSGTRLEYIFRDTGKFFITLTSKKGETFDKDTLEVNIESRPPNVQFTSEVASSETPNTYIFDGSNSFDPDYPDNQELEFEWFVNDTAIDLFDTNERNSRGKYTFPEKGTYHVMLRVTDEEDKSHEERRDIKIANTLSVRLNMRPEVATRGEKVLFSVTAPHAKTYEWKVGTNPAVHTENNRFVTSFATSGVFPVTVTVTDTDGVSNTASGKIYVTEDDEPFSVLEIKSDSVLTSTQESVCSGEEAVTVDRSNPVAFSAERSINTDGRTDNLTYFWKIGLNKTSTQKNISYTFDELGCEEIILTVSDKITGASHTSREWVRVVNLSPIFNDISVDVENLDMDPMRVNLKMLGAKDPDGVIRSYTWYYYTDRDDQAQGFRITRIPEATFILPKITGRYYFAVMMEDSNGVKVNTKEVSDVLFSTPDLYVNTNLSTPIIENFQADNTEVRFGDVTRLSLDVKTPVTSDVSDKSEYRWDIDGDGFYDVKTTTPFYEFKYVYPGEYNPKVKVTHKGISATKSLTVVVKNSLIPKATLQIMGNKIVAYNTSSGIFQSVNWYLDGKRISDNRDYLIYETEGTTTKNLKLEISDGKITESVVYPIERNLKNKTLLNKITRPLVVLTSMSGSDIQEAPDEIVWEDPMVPAFLYLGESRGEVRYYIVDTDIDIDTDLSGGKDDDADNKGTASYRSGRPFQIPKGNKRVTTMKIRLVGGDNKDIDTREIRVTRKFLDITEPDIIPDTTAPQTYNLSQEDKDRIEKLRNLVQGAPEEEKQAFNKILDQLGDNWYDVADRIQTLNLFSNAVNASPTLTADLKKKILEQINIVYTQGDDQIEERQLALKMITEYLAKSPKKVQIFGDDKTPGLINEIIDNPEYYEENLKVIQKIMDDYVDPDTTLSAEVKKDIEEKLRVLAGAPPAPVTDPVDTGDTTSNILSVLLWILGGVMSIVLGGVGIVYARQKLSVRNGGDHRDVSPSPQPEPALLSPTTVSTESTPDWLKEDDSLFGSEDVFSDGAASATSETHQPDWLQDTATPVTTFPETSIHVEKEEQPAPSIAETTIEPTVQEESTGDVPDWLQGAPSPEEEGSDDTTPKITAIGEETRDVFPETSPTDTINDIPESSLTMPAFDDTSLVSDTPQNDNDIPDWLRGADVSPETDTILPADEDNKDALTEEGVSDEGEVTTPSEKKATSKNGKKSKKATIESEKTTKKKTSVAKKAIAPADHLLESEHDMLLPPQTTDNPL